jgi:hypothetical protein
LLRFRVIGGVGLPRLLGQVVEEILVWRFGLMGRHIHGGYEQLAVPGRWRVRAGPETPHPA